MNHEWLWEYLINRGVPSRRHISDIVKTKERRMKKFAIRLGITAICATAVLAASMILPVDAAVSASSDAKKHHKRHPREPAISSKARPSDNPFPPMNEDPDRKAAGGGY
jgi:hypothetical protein